MFKVFGSVKRFDGLIEVVTESNMSQGFASGKRFDGLIEV
jgi:hypothetical protein